MLTRQAVILVGGKGTRLGDLTASTPKPLLPLNNDVVFLDEVLFNVARYGFSDIVLAAGHLGDQFMARYHQRSVHGANIRVVVEPAPAGTGGALGTLADILEPSFLLMNGDTTFDINLRRLDELLAKDRDAIAILALRRVANASRFGSVTLRNGRIIEFHEKRPQAESLEGCVNGGIGLFRREVLSYVERKSPCSIENEIYPALAAEQRLLGQEFSGYFIDIGLPDTLKKARAELPLQRPAVFFDRDGVLNEDDGYTHKPEDLRFISGAVETIRRVNDIGALAFVVTNQAGVAHGYYSLEDVDHFHAAMALELARNGAHIDAFYSCPYHSEARSSIYRCVDHPDRKPNPGMILRACREWPVDLANSILIGDRESDIEAARRAGLAGHLFKGGDLAAFSAPLLASMAEILAPLANTKVA